MKLVDIALRGKSHYITSPFGMRKHPITGAYAMHTGCDYGTNGNKYPLYAIEDGQVWACGKTPDGAIYVWVKYPRINKDVNYLHMDQLDVKVGQNVTKDTKLGNVGTTGNSTGIHLHLELRKMGTQELIDPEVYDYQPVSPAPTPVPESTDTIHVVKATKPTETLWGLAETYLGKGNLYPEIMKWNGLTSTEIYPGQKLIVKKGTPAPVPTPEPTDTKLNVGDSVLVIAKGNTQESGKGAEAGSSKVNTGQVCTIIKLAKDKNAPFPYAVGIGKTVTGWFKAEALKKV